MNVPSFWQLPVIGLLIIVAVSLNQYQRRLRTELSAYRSMEGVTAAAEPEGGDGQAAGREETFDPGDRTGAGRCSIPSRDRRDRVSPRPDRHRDRCRQRIGRAVACSLQRTGSQLWPLT